MIRALPHILARVFGPPLLIAPAKLDQMLSGLHAALHARGSLIQDAGFNVPDFRAKLTASLRGDGKETEEAPIVHARGYRIEKGVATVPVHGVLVRRAGQITPDSTELQSYESVGRTLRNARSDSRVRGILLDIDSPGGEAGGIFDLAAEIHAARSSKPIWAIAADDALSAAYVLASAAERIWATQTAALGSLGVVALHADQSAFDAAEGLKYTYVYRGAHKIDANPHGPLTDEAQAAIQTEVDRLYSKLIEMVAQHRAVDRASLQNTEAAIYFGDNAKAQRLADSIGTIDEAHAALVTHIQQKGLRMDTTTQPPAAAAADDQQNVIQLRVDEARQAILAQTREIAELCALAKHPELAAKYIAEGLTAQAVRTKLQEVQAAAAAKTPITAIDTSGDNQPMSAPNRAREAAAKRLAAMTANHGG